MNEKYLNLSKRILHYLIFSLIFTEAILYPLKLKDTWILKFREIFYGIDNFFGTKNIFFNIWDIHFEPFLYFGISPLVLKAAIAGLFSVPLILFFFLYKINLKN